MERIASKFPSGAIVESRTASTYRVLRGIRTGGNAQTYLAFGTAGPLLGTVAVLKVLERQGEDAATRFSDEVGALSRLEHPAIIRIYDRGEISLKTADMSIHTPSFPFYAMRYYERTLEQLIQVRLSLHEKIIYSLQLLAAVAFLGGHKQRYVHRDIKPSNILVDGFECVLSDFGLLYVSSELRLEEPPGDDRAAFAKRYPSPELLLYSKGGKPPGPESDVFQLGLVLAQLYTREIPINSAADPLVVKPLQEIAGTLGATVRTILQRMLRSDGVDRITAAAALDELTREFSEHCLVNIKSTGSPFYT